MNTKRLTLATLAVLATALTIGSAQAQQTAKVYRVGALFNRVPGPDFDVLKKELARLGYVEGTNIVFEPRFAEGKLDRLPGFAAELVAMNVDVIATYGGPPTNISMQGHHDDSHRRGAGRRPGRHRCRRHARTSGGKRDGGHQP